MKQTTKRANGPSADERARVLAQKAKAAATKGGHVQTAAAKKGASVRPARVNGATKAVTIPDSLPKPVSRTKAERSARSLVVDGSKAHVMVMRDPHQKRPSDMEPFNKGAHDAVNQLNKPKNLRGNPEEAKKTRAEAMIAKLFEADQLFAPDVRRWMNLLDNPFEAEWGDAGEIAVRPCIYNDTTPPAITTTIRNHGQRSVTIPAGYKMWVAFAVGAGNSYDPVPGYAEAVRSISPCVAYNTPGTAAEANELAFFPGCPLLSNGAFAGNNLTSGATAGVGVTNAGGQGCAGYLWLSAVSGNDGLPTTVTNVGSVAAGQFAGEASLLTWGNNNIISRSNAGIPTDFKYRPVAGGIMVTPSDTSAELGGIINASVVPVANNYTWADPTATNHGVADNAGAWLALPDHVIKRGDACFQLNWLPGSADYDFVSPYGLSSTAVGVFNSVAFGNTEAGQVRSWLEIIPPDSTQPYPVTLTYIGFYEVAGVAVNEIGSVPRPNPQQGAKVATAIQENLSRECERVEQVAQGATLEVLKDNPKVGPMIESAETPKEAKSFLSEIAGFAKEVMPLVATLL